MSRLENWAFYFITDTDLTKQGILRDAEDAIKGGAKVIQYREKTKPADEILEEAKALATICKNHDVDLIINDSPELAKTTGANGVHLGQSDMTIAEARQILPNGIIGKSCNSIENVIQATNDGADYVTVGPVFQTSTKPDIAELVGIEGVKLFRENTSLPLVAIGGIKLENVGEIVLAGADMVVAISATVGLADVEASVREFEDIIRDVKAKST